MYSSPDRIGQLARDHHHEMIAAARHRQPRQPRPARSRPAPRITALTRRLVAALTKSTTTTTPT
ncbi:MAG TPA: hypothetical protein VGJ19_23710, partial [Streptosporangiaceae bacterium]